MVATPRFGLCNVCDNCHRSHKSVISYRYHITLLDMGFLIVYAQSIMIEPRNREKYI